MRYDHIEEGDPEIFELMRRESLRQNRTLDLIASENLASEAVLEATGSIFTNKYAEGYPNARYYGGCEVADQVEMLAIERAKRLFGADHANVQPHSGPKQIKLFIWLFSNLGYNTLHVTGCWRSPFSRCTCFHDR